MSVGNVSFKSVVAVSGTSRNIKKIRKKMQQYIMDGNVIHRDVTQKYKYSPSSGEIARAAQSGDKVELYITGEDAKRVSQCGSDGEKTDSLLIYLRSYININKMPVGEAVEKIINS